MGGELLKLVGFGLGLVDRTGWWGAHLGQTLRVFYFLFTHSKSKEYGSIVRMEKNEVK